MYKNIAICARFKINVYLCSLVKTLVTNVTIQSLKKKLS